MYISLGKEVPLIRAHVTLRLLDHTADCNSSHIAVSVLMKKIHKNLLLTVSTHSYTDRITVPGCMSSQTTDSIL